MTPGAGQPQAFMARQPRTDFTLESQAILDVINTVGEEIEPGARHRRRKL
jgi:hypothetical protein